MQEQDKTRRVITMTDLKRDAAATEYTKNITPQSVLYRADVSDAFKAGFDAAPTVTVSEADGDLKELTATAYANAKNKGFWDAPRNVGEMLMLIVSELGEAIEAHRKGLFCKVKECQNLLTFKEYLEYTDTNAYDYYVMRLSNPDTEIESKYDQRILEAKKVFFEAYIKDTFEDEIADTFIRLFDLCGGLNIDIVYHILRKMEYNATRERLNGKNY